LFGQFVAAGLAVKLILSGVDGLGLVEDLAGNLLVIEILVATGVGVQLGPVDGDHPDRYRRGCHACLRLFTCAVQPAPLPVRSDTGTVGLPLA
jgi:hypothetical protein